MQKCRLHFLLLQLLYCSWKNCCRKNAPIKKVSSFTRRRSRSPCTSTTTTVRLLSKQPSYSSPSWFDMVLVGPRVTSVEAKLCRKKNLKERRKPPFLLQLYLTTKHLERRSAEKERKGFIAFNLQKHTHSRLQLTLIYLSAPLLSRFSLASFRPNFGDNSGS